MEITAEQYKKIKDSLPIQRGNVKLHNLQVLNAILYVAEQGCKWRGLPSRFGNWHSIYTRMNRWAKSGVLDRVFEKLQTEQIVRIKIEAFSLDSTSIKVHPDGTGALKKTDLRPSANPAADGTPRFIWLPRMLERLEDLGPMPEGLPMLMDKAYEGSGTALPQAEGIPPHLLQIRKARCSLPRLYQFRFDRRSPQIVLTRPKHSTQFSRSSIGRFPRTPAVAAV